MTGTFLYRNLLTATYMNQFLLLDREKSYSRLEYRLTFATIWILNRNRSARFPIATAPMITKFKNG